MTAHKSDLIDETMRIWGRRWDPLWLAPRRVRVLIVTDDDGSFTKEHRFSLTELVDALKYDPHMFVTFAVTTAHRSKSTASNPFPKHADIQEFLFTNPNHFAPDKFDEIWLFGVGNAEVDTGVRHPLSPQELRILSQFMDAGGGVFATGDHEDLGVDLCGEVPRVRSMRRWHFSKDGYDYNTLPELPDNAPPVMGPHRHDTLVPGPDATYAFDDQSDDIPQKILPKIYISEVGHVFQSRRPHPLLCGPHGVIDVLPDHMHEGECEVPENLDKQFSFDGYTGTEYPSTPAGYRPIPEVIAYGVVKPGHTTRLDPKDFFNPPQSGFLDPTTIADTFGAIGVYDGHVADVGRVVVDSTFHHFFNINLIGSGSNSLDSVKQQGFLASPQGQKHYEQIRAYFQNIAIWLAPPAAQQAMFEKLLWGARWDSQLRMSGGHLTTGAAVWAEWVMFGQQAREALDRLVSSCTRIHWLLMLVDPLAILLGDVIYELIHRPDPPPEERFDPGRVLVNGQQVLDAVLGGIMLSIMRRAPSRQLQDRRASEADTHVVIREAIEQGVREGFGVTLEQYRSCLVETERWLALLNKRIEGNASYS